MYEGVCLSALSQQQATVQISTFFESTFVFLPQKWACIASHVFFFFTPYMFYNNIYLSYNRHILYAEITF